jgi:hypothetical protein
MEKYNFEVVFVSKDEHKFIFKSVAETKDEAIKSGVSKLTQNGYDSYGYTVLEVKKLNQEL